MASTLTDISGGAFITLVAQVVAAGAVAHLVYLLVRWRLVLRRTAGIPGPHFGPLGSLPGIARNIHRLYDWNAQFLAEYGDNVRFTLPFWTNQVLVFTKSPKNIEWFLKTNFRNYNKPDDLRLHMLDLLGDGIFRINHGE